MDTVIYQGFCGPCGTSQVVRLPEEQAASPSITVSCATDPSCPKVTLYR